MALSSVPEVEQALRAESYLPDHGLATAIYLALVMRRPLLLEGEPGVGKTEVAKTLARILDAELIRLQCYEGIDASQALYEWDYSRQLLYARALQAGELDVHARVQELYGPEFLLERPLLKAIRSGEKAVLLIDELDRADDEFEAFLLEVLSDFSVTVPELGTIGATARRPSSSRRTVRGSCTTRSSAAASTTGSTSRTSSGRWRSSPFASPMSRSSLPARSRRR